MPACLNAVTNLARILSFREAAIENRNRGLCGRRANQFPVEIAVSGSLHLATLLTEILGRFKESK